MSASAGEWPALGARVLLPAVVRDCYVDADAARHRGDDGSRLVLLLPDGMHLHAVRLADVVTVDAGDDKSATEG